MTPLVQSLWITLIGMGLVFVGILLLWGLMEVLMRFSARFSVEEDQKSPEEEPAEPETSHTEEIPPSAANLEPKKRAAAAAVAIALALRPAPTLAAPPSSAGSAWQTVTRSSQLNQATHIPRKTRGSVR